MPAVIRTQLRRPKPKMVTAEPAARSTGSPQHIATQATANPATPAGEALDRDERSGPLIGPAQPGAG